MNLRLRPAGWSAGSCVVVALFATGCQAKHGFDSPEAAGKAWAEAVNGKSREHYLRLYATEEELASFQTCSGPNDLVVRMITARDKALAGVVSDFAADVKIEWQGLVSEEASETRTRGSEKDGCTASVDFEIKRFLTRLRMVKGKLNQDANGKFTFIGVAGRWYLLET